MGRKLWELYRRVPAGTGVQTRGSHPIHAVGSHAHYSPQRPKHRTTAGALEDTQHDWRRGRIEVYGGRPGSCGDRNAAQAHFWRQVNSSVSMFKGWSEFWRLGLSFFTLYQQTYRKFQNSGLNFPPLVINAIGTVLRRSNTQRFQRWYRCHDVTP